MPVLLFSKKSKKNVQITKPPEEEILEEISIALQPRLSSTEWVKLLNSQLENLSFDLGLKELKPQIFDILKTANELFFRAQQDVCEMITCTKDEKFERKSIQNLEHWEFNKLIGHTGSVDEVSHEFSTSGGDELTPYLQQILKIGLTKTSAIKLLLLQYNLKEIPSKISCAITNIFTVAIFYKECKEVGPQNSAQPVYIRKGLKEYVHLTFYNFQDALNWSKYLSTVFKINREVKKYAKDRKQVNCPPWFNMKILNSNNQPPILSEEQLVEVYLIADSENRISKIGFFDKKNKYRILQLKENEISAIVEKLEKVNFRSDGCLDNCDELRFELSQLQGIVIPTDPQQHYIRLSPADYEQVKDMFSAALDFDALTSRSNLNKLGEIEFDGFEEHEINIEQFEEKQTFYCPFQ